MVLIAGPYLHSIYPLGNIHCMQYFFQGCSTYISSIIKDDEVLGIVEFSDQPRVNRHLTIVNNETRSDLLDGLPKSASGYTSIGGGESI